jgi:DNA topoisomerase-1
MPTDLGRLVNGFLTTNFNRYVDYDFTAEMEEELDQISNGELDWLKVLREFWASFADNLDKKRDTDRGVPLPAAEPRVSNWKDYASRVLSPEWQDAGRPPETCPKCNGQLFLQNSKRGPFVGCSGYPNCDYTRPWGGMPEGPIQLGVDPKTGLDVLLMRGPYGLYVQLGPTVEGAPTKPRRASWPTNLPVAAADLVTALKVLSLPRVLGNHPDTGKPIEANVGRFGPYVKHEGAYKSIPKSDNVYDIGLERALELLAQPKTGRGGAGRQLGLHPIDNKPIELMDGRYGPYIKHGNVNVTVPSDMDAATLSLDDAVDLLAEKAAKELAKSGSTAAPTPAALRGNPRRPGPGMAGGGGGRPRAQPGAGRGPNNNNERRGMPPPPAGRGQPKRPAAGNPARQARGNRAPQRPAGKAAPRRRAP